MTGIYKITSPTNKVYIGQTRDTNRRFRQYKNMRCKTQTKLYCSLISHGAENHIFEVIEECDEGAPWQELDEREIYYMTFYKEQGFELLNLAEGGKSGPGKSNKGRKESPEANAKKRIWMKGKQNSLGYKFTKEQSENLSQKLKGRQAVLGKHWTLTEAQKERYRGNKYCLGKKRPEYVVEQMRKRFTGNKLRLGLLPTNTTKKVIDTITGIIYPSIKNAAEHINMNPETLRRRLRGELINNTNLIYL